jgi:hypothetical protein
MKKNISIAGILAKKIDIKGSGGIIIEATQILKAVLILQ